MFTREGRLAESESELRNDGNYRDGNSENQQEARKRRREVSDV